MALVWESQVKVINSQGWWLTHHHIVIALKYVGNLDQWVFVFCLLCCLTLGAEVWVILTPFMTRSHHCARADLSFAFFIYSLYSQSQCHSPSFSDHAPVFTVSFFCGPVSCIFRVCSPFQLHMWSRAMDFILCLSSLHPALCFFWGGVGGILLFGFWFFSVLYKLHFIKTKYYAE